MSKTLATQFQSAEDSPGLLLWRLTNAWQAQQRAALKPFELTHMQFVLLATLTYAEKKATFTQQQLAQYLRVDVMMTSQVLRKLEAKGLIKRTPSSQDKRAFVVSPTPRGMELANQAVKKVEEVDRAFFAPLAGYTTNFIGMMRQLVK